MIGDIFDKVFTSDKILKNEPLKNHTSFRIGGAVDVLFLPSNVKDIMTCIDICKKNNTNFFVMGNGSNILAKDTGYRGVVIKITKNMNEIEMVDDGTVYAQSGVSLKALSKYFLEKGLKGFEFADGIPGTLGGAISMNAGAYEEEMKMVVSNVNVFDIATNKTMTLSNEEMKFGYRHSIAKEKDMIILMSSFRLKKGNKEDIQSKINRLNSQRQEKQPLDYPSAGSTFKRPQGYFAGKLISDSGLKGFAIGGAQVSKKHAGFIINTGNATAEDVLNLIAHIKNEVNKNYKILLEEEVVIIG